MTHTATYERDVTADDGSTHTISIDVRHRPDGDFVVKTEDVPVQPVTDDSDGASFENALEAFWDERASTIQTLLVEAPDTHSYDGGTFTKV